MSPANWVYYLRVINLQFQKEFLKIHLFWFPMEMMQKEISPPLGLFVCISPSIFPILWPVSLSSDTGTTGLDIIIFLWKCGEDKICVSFATEGEKGTRLWKLYQNLHEIEATGKDVIHAHTFKQSSVRQGLWKPSLTSLGASKEWSWHICLVLTKNRGGFRFMALFSFVRAKRRKKNKRKI